MILGLRRTTVTSVGISRFKSLILNRRVQAVKNKVDPKKFCLLGLGNEKTHNTFNLGFPRAQVSLYRSSARSSASVVDQGNDVGPLEEMLMGSGRLTTVAHKLWTKVVKHGDTVVDATCGNGHDTLFLAQLALDPHGTSGRVVGFDVQETAIQATADRLSLHASSHPPQVGARVNVFCGKDKVWSSGVVEACLDHRSTIRYDDEDSETLDLAKERWQPEGQRVELYQACHSGMGEFVAEEKASLVCFNLGYLPGGDQNIITLAGSTRAALQAATKVVKPGGLISILAYVRHDGGEEDFNSVSSFAGNLNPKQWNVTICDLLNRNGNPVLICCYKKPHK